MAPSTTLGSKEKHKANITTVMQNLPISPARNPLTIFWAFLAPRCLNACAAKKAFDPLLTPPPSNTEKAVEALIKTKETTAIKVVADIWAIITLWTGGGFKFVTITTDGLAVCLSLSQGPPRHFSCYGGHQKHAHYRDFAGVSQHCIRIILTLKIKGSFSQMAVSGNAISTRISDWFRVGIQT